MRIVTLPGVFRPISDTRLLGGALRRLPLGADTAVADLCTGSGALAVGAALAGAGRVTAVDVSRRAVATVRLNAALNRVSVRAVRGDLLAALPGERFDVVVSNPPYVPDPSDDLPSRGAARAWEGGRDGRTLLDRLIAQAPSHLRPGGRLLVVHSELCGTGATLEAMADVGLAGEVVARQRGPLGPLMRDRRAHLEEMGLLGRGDDVEEVVVIAGVLAGRRAPAPERQVAAR